MTYTVSRITAALLLSLGTAVAAPTVVPAASGKRKL